MIGEIFKLQPAFQLNIIFFVGMSILVLIFSDRLPFLNFFMIYISMVLFQIFLSKMPENSILSFIKKIGFPVLSVLIAFDTVGELIHYLNLKDIDLVLLEMDYLILGFYPYIYFEKIANPFLTELMQISYCVYYFLPFVIGVYLIKNEKKQEFYRALFIVLLCYYLSYIGYMLFPALGPRYSIAHMFQTELNGLLLANKINEFLNYLEGIKRDAFPSGHVGVSLVVLFLMLKYSKKLFWFSLIPVLLLIVSTVYCRYHYFVDVLAGIILAVVSLVAGNLYYNFWLTKNETFKLEKREN
ncbi:MAG: phosphatase PAP2 family protein [Thermodesulfovibrio sp.]|nr:phosphatase PAP2 family protein [Thermodesulfovibrio sp.]MCX7724728.1 phosphatase PAP2 family protein [Thermodesulfovibrio sp.]MDW7971919.1 phosphatase PAP2 family protein [Thermodesulfovibrio sp.]